MERGKRKERMKNNSNDKSIQHQFDAYCKTVLNNEAKNIRKQNARIRKKEKSLDYLNHSELPFSYCESSERNNYSVLGIEIFVSNLQLSDAIDSLSTIKKQIILLYYFAGFNHQEIAKILNMSTSGIWYQRTRAVEQLRKEYNTW